MQKVHIFEREGKTVALVQVRGLDIGAAQSVCATPLGARVHPSAVGLAGPRGRLVRVLLTQLPPLTLLSARQYPDVRTADMAKAALEGHAMYDGGHNVVRACCCLAGWLGRAFV